MRSTDARRAVYEAVEVFNAQADPEKAIVPDDATPLLDPSGQVIDSLGFAFLIVTIEQVILDSMNREVVLFDDSLMDLDLGSPDNPFLSLGSLIRYLSEKLT